MGCSASSSVPKSSTNNSPATKSRLEPDKNLNNSRPDSCKSDKDISPDNLNSLSEYQTIEKASNQISSPQNNKMMSASNEEADVNKSKELQDPNPTAPVAVLDDEVEPTPQPLTCEEILDTIKHHHEIIKSLDKNTSEDGVYVKPIRMAIKYVSDAYFAFKKIPGITLPDIESGRHKAAKLLLDLKLVDLVAEVYLAHFPMKWSKDDGYQIVAVYFPLSNGALILGNYSDASDEFAIKLSEIPGLLERFRESLVTYLPGHMRISLKTFDKYQLELILGVVHNISMRDTTMGKLREHHFTEAIQPYLNSPDEQTVVVSLASLAGIIDEKEAEMINTRPQIVKVLFRWLKKGMDDKLRRYNCWSCSESAFTIRKLAINDVNKKLLVELGALQLLVELARSGNEKEQYESIQAIWALTFDEDNQKRICQDTSLGVIDLLLDLKKSENKAIVKGCNGALWNLRDAMKSSPVEKYRKIAEESSEVEKSRKDKKAPSQQGHIMISYQWADQKMLMRVRDGLKAAGYRVWMDIDQMGGSTLQAMAEAVENATIVLVAMSHKYKNSPNCRAEAEYAYQKQKKIIPLKLERGYIPDGWLGFIAGTKLFFEFTDKYPFDVKLSGLIKEINGWEVSNAEGDPVRPQTASITRSHPPQAVDTPDHATVARVPSFVKTTVMSVRQWTDNDVQNWINKHDLKLCNLGAISGPEIALLMKMQHEAPDCFYKMLQDTLKLKSLLSLSKFVWALNDLQAESTS